MNFDDLMKIVRGAVDAEIAREAATAGQLTLGELQARLEAMPQDAQVRIDSGRVPGTLDSYRGYYAHIAIDPEPERDGRTVDDLLHEVTGAIGKTFTGYKGGDFVMTKMTPVWVSHWGYSEGIRVVGVKLVDGKVILETKQHD